MEMLMGVLAALRHKSSAMTVQPERFVLESLHQNVVMKFEIRHDDEPLVPQRRLQSGRSVAWRSMCHDVLRPQQFFSPRAPTCSTPRRAKTTPGVEPRGSYDSLR
jgi:hypothetical protein